MNAIVAMNDFTEVENKLVPADLWNSDLLNRRVKFLARRFDNNVALLLVALNKQGKPLRHYDSNAVRNTLLEKVDGVICTRSSSVMMLDETTLAVVVADFSGANKLKTLVNAIVRECSAPIVIDGETLYLTASGGVSSPLLPRVEVTSLIPFSRMALAKAESYKVAYYPEKDFLQAVV